MATISTGESGPRGKKSVDSEIPLIPFIDLLLCCVMFLLVTAVWNEIAGMQAVAPAPGPSPDNPTTIDPPPQLLTLEIGTAGYVLSSEAGDRLEIAKTDAGYDLVALREHLDARRRLLPNGRDIRLTPDDGVVQGELVATMDVVIGAGYEGLAFDGR